MTEKTEAGAETEELRDGDKEQSERHRQKGKEQRGCPSSVTLLRDQKQFRSLVSISTLHSVLYSRNPRIHHVSTQGFMTRLVFLRLSPGALVLMPRVTHRYCVHSDMALFQVVEPNCAPAH